MKLARTLLIGLLVVVASSGTATAQTTTAPGIDAEVYDPADGDNSFCVPPGGQLRVNVFLRPGSTTTSCSPACSGPSVLGGPASIATGLIALDFDPAVLSLVSAESNPDPSFAAVDGLVQLQEAGSGRVGWALAGDWSADGDPSSILASPCDMAKLDAPGWVLTALFTASATPGTTSLVIPDQGDDWPFPLSFADACGSAPFTTASGDIDVVLGASVLINASCGEIEIFADGFESSDLGAWSFSAS